MLRDGAWEGASVSFVIEHDYDEHGECRDCGDLLDGGGGAVIEELLDKSTLEFMAKRDAKPR